MKKILLVSFVLLTLSISLFALSTSRAGNVTENSNNTTYENIYRHGPQRAGVLFVEDPGQSGFGPLTKPDPMWVSQLDATMGAGNYDWWGPIVDTGDGPPLDTMLLYDLVIWTCYDVWWTDVAPTPTAVANLTSYITQGGKVWLLGHDALYSSSSAATMLQTHFGLASYTEDYGSDVYNITLTGAVEFAGFSWNDSCDYQANGFWPDELVPTGDAHVIFNDGSHTPIIMRNDYTNSFWTVGLRVGTPVATQEAVVDSMLRLFGVLGAVEENPIALDLPFSVKAVSQLTGRPGVYFSTPTECNVNIEVLDLSGRTVANLYNGMIQGERTFYFENESSGTYIYRVTANGATFTGKLISVQ